MCFIVSDYIVVKFLLLSILKKNKKIRNMASLCI